MSSDRDNEFRSALEAAVSSFGVAALSEEQTSQLVEHYGMLCRWNKHINLTRVIAPREAATIHYAESLFGARFTSDRTVLDIGSGAGFPAITLAVIKPEVRVTALEANHKKALFLLEAKDVLRLANLEVVTARLEEFDWAGREFLTSRALDHAQSVFPSVIKRMSSNQRLMLYCAADLVATLQHQLVSECEIETHPIPLSESRVVAIFSV